jgi:hypothetical protein
MVLRWVEALGGDARVKVKPEGVERHGQQRVGADEEHPPREDVVGQRPVQPGLVKAMVSRHRWECSFS